MTEIVLPTLEEYVADTSSRRKAYLACMVTYHMADYLKAAGVRDPQADMIGSCEGAWRVVKGVANGAKHRHSTRGSDQVNFLAGSDEFRPPAVAGMLECGSSELGDSEGSIIVPTQDDGLWADVLPCLRTVVRYFRFIYSGSHFDPVTMNYVP